MRRELSIEYLQGFTVILTLLLVKDLITGELVYALVGVGNLLFAIIAYGIIHFNTENPLIQNRLICFMGLNFCFFITIIK